MSRGKVGNEFSGVMLTQRDAVMLTRGQMERTRRIALRLTGMELFERHREVLDRRLRRLGIPNNAAGFDALLDGVDAGEAHASPVGTCIVTRDPEPVPRYHASQFLRSGGCSQRISR